uniref:Uncharacterized protein n=1 Tax=Pseudo-nitzschia australis TaxID=44445 RepID=A0A7S4AQH2_9STRA
MNEESPLVVRNSKSIKMENEDDQLPQSTSGQKRNTSIEDVVEQFEEIVHEMTTSKPADPDELTHEVIEHSMEITTNEYVEQQPNGDLVGDDLDTDNSLDRNTSRLGQDLAYPDEQMIERHFTSSPEKLGVVSMAVVIFYNVSGGPFGIETTVRAGGNFYAILGFLIMPFVWSLQEALMTAELGTAFPEASGGVVWVEEAFGHGAGWMSGYLSWIAGATGMQ